MLGNRGPKDHIHIRKLGSNVQEGGIPKTIGSWDPYVYAVFGLPGNAISTIQDMGPWCGPLVWTQYIPSIYHRPDRI